tara:strand:- start:1680 stop:1874 length:195 start_codon:yes stop_codon:yes gene_type:complete
MLEDTKKSIPSIGDRSLGSKLVTALALHAALTSGDPSDLDALTASILEESILAYAKALGIKAEA